LRETEDQMNHTAQACHFAASLIAAGHATRASYAGMTVYQVESIAGAALNRMHQVAELAKQNRATSRQMETAQRHIAKAAAYTAEQSRAGKIAQRDLRTSVDLNTYRFASESKKQSPLFAVFGKALIEQIERMLNNDAASEKLAEVRKARPDITENEDKHVVQRLDLALEQLGDRAADWRKKLVHPAKKIVPPSAIQGKGA
jgi:hypothetical protein